MNLKDILIKDLIKQKEKEKKIAKKFTFRKLKIAKKIKKFLIYK